MSTLNPDVIQLRVLIDGTPARKELAELTQEAQEVKSAMKGLKKTSDEFVEGSKRISEITARQAELRKEIGLDSLSMKELNAEYGRARAAFNAATPKTEQWVQAAHRVNELKEARRDLTDQNRIDMKVWEAIRGEIKLNSMNTGQLALETKRLQNVLKNPDLSGTERAKAARELALVTDRTQQLTNANRIAADAWAIERKELKLTDLTMEQLGMESARLKAKLQTMAPNDIGLRKTRVELQNVENRTKALQTGLGPLGRAFQSVKGQIAGAAAVVGSFLFGGAILQGFKSLVAGSAKVSDEFSDIQKVTGLSAEAVKSLNSELAGIDTRTATSELRGIAIGLGQLGEAVNADTVKAIDKINLALGTEFGTDAQTITTTVSVLRNNLLDLKSGNYGEDVGKIGNAILVLGQAGLATAPVVSDIGTRIAGVAGTFGVTSGQILGTAAAFQELGINSERGSTAYTKILQKISQQPGVFADVVRKAGGDAEGFIKLVNTDMQAAFLTVAKSARVAGSENTAFGAILKDLETSGAGVSELLAKAGANTELFTQRADIATEALTNQNAINRQAALANDNLAGKVEKLGKAWTRLTSSREVLDWVGEVITLAENAVDWIQRNADTIAFLGKVLFNAGVAWASYKTYMVASEAATRFSLATQEAYAKTVAFVTGRKAGAAVATSAATEATLADTAATGASIPVEADKAAATEAVTAAKEGEIAAAEANVVATTDESVAKEAAVVATEAETAAVEADAIAKKGGATASELNTVATEGETVAKKGNVVATEAEAGAQAAATLATEAGAVAENISTVATEGNTLATEANVVVDKAAAVAQATSNAATTAGMVATEAATVATEGATVAVTGLNAATKVSPWGLLIAGAVTAYTVLSTFRKETDDTADSIKALSKSDQDAAKEMYALYFKILLTNKGSKERNELLGQLKALYPEYLGKLDLEKLSNQELSKSIEEVNKQLINKAIIQRKDNANEVVRQKAVDAFEDYDSRLRASQSLLLKLSETYGVDLAMAIDKSKTPIEQLQQGLKAIQSTAKFKEGTSGFFSSFSDAAGDAARLRGSILSITSAYQQYDKFKTEASNAEEQRQQLALQLNQKQIDSDQDLFAQKTKDIAGIRQQINALRASLAERPDDRSFIEAQITDLEAKAAALQQEADGLPAIGEKVVRTIEQINADIAAVTQQRDKESSTSPQYKGFTKQLEELEKEKQRITGESGKQGRAKTEEDLSALEESMRQWREKMRQETLSDDEKELAQLDAKHEEELRKYKEQQAKLIAAKKLTPEQAEADVKQQEDQNLDERTLLMGQQADRKADAMREANEKIQAILGEGHNAELQANVEFYAQEIEQGKAANRNVLDLERAHKDALLKLYEQNALDLLDKEGKKWEELILLAKQKLQDFDDANAKAGITPDGAVLEDRKKLSDGIIDLEKAQAKALKRINDDRRRKEKQAEHEFNRAIREETIRKLQNFSQVASATGDLISSIVQYMDAGVAAAEMRADQDGVRTNEEIANIERLKKERREAALVAIAVQGAIAIANGVAKAMELGWPAGIVAAISAVAVVVGLIAQAKAMMNDTSGTAGAPAAQPALNAVPEGEKGMLASGDGRTITSADGGGILDGPRHGDDGIKMVNPKTGRIVAEVEGDETALILSRAATQANADLIPRMLQASKEGKRMDFFQAPKQPNVQRMQQAMRVVHMRDGGAVGSAATFAATGGTTGKMETLMGQMVAYMGQMAKNQKETAEATKRMPTTFKGVVSLNPEYDRQMAQWKDMKDRYSAGRKTGG